MSDLTPLQAADRYCHYLVYHHYENFSVAAPFLPRARRTHLARIYAFCRTTDDLGDESSRDAARRLLDWRRQVDECFDGAEPVHPVLIALAESIRDCGFERQPFLDLIAANLQDQQVSSYETWEKLHRYCTLSAVPVGRMVLRAFDVHDAAAVPLSDDVCIGLQLANFAQDVARDREKGRTYLLQSDIRAHGTTGAVRALCDRAESLLQSGRTLEEMVPGVLRAQLSLYRLGGLAIVDAIRRIDYRTAQQRPEVSAMKKVALAATALQQMRWRQGHVRAPAGSRRAA